MRWPDTMPGLASVPEGFAGSAPIFVFSDRVRYPDVDVRTHVLHVAQINRAVSAGRLALAAADQVGLTLHFGGTDEHQPDDRAEYG